MLFECRHTALAVNRSKHRALLDGISDVGKLMAAAYMPELELATILGSCMQGILQGLEALRASQTSHRLLSWADV